MSVKHQYDVYVPRCDNDGVDFPEVLLSHFRDEMIDMFGGLSVIPHVDGYWKDAEGKVVCDEIYIHRIVCDCSLSNHGKIKKLHGWLKIWLRQDEIFILRSEVNVEQCPASPVYQFNRDN